MPRVQAQAVMLVHGHRHPHVLLLRDAQQTYHLPRVLLKPGEDEIHALRAYLSTALAPSPPADRAVDHAAAPKAADDAWEVGELLATWWRPTAMAPLVPYVPAHVTKPVEKVRMYLIMLPPRKALSAPPGGALVAVGLHDITPAYGPEIVALPALLSRFDLVCQGTN
ncbi:hypothetical protein CXG81DRAFT_14347 [Caulochytrium protostelioides]|uniref:Cleavage and polyadenylation specificity factor subunit 5 n=1 Tax=Caulochytrium protostelioides TaxID=1555241 RepID=A0A4P9X3G0_9FUNG|nr:hypothetical protein CXG81DRAFT_14347 [Caulochytrium protostelioides]|eukprot:RKO99550.1 hypothetical protein CXG81DRAFT_14347 [Caulochytrium protostelioides]